MGYYQKKKISFQKSLVKGTKIFLKKKKPKSANMLMSDIGIFLKKKKKQSLNMIVNDIKTLQKNLNFHCLPQVNPTNKNFWDF